MTVSAAVVPGRKVAAVNAMAERYRHVTAVFVRTSRSDWTRSSGTTNETQIETLAVLYRCDQRRESRNCWWPGAGSNRRPTAFQAVAHTN
jgi:hypothetical protein